MRALIYRAWQRKKMDDIGTNSPAPHVSPRRDGGRGRRRSPSRRPLDALPTLPKRHREGKARAADRAAGEAVVLKDGEADRARVAHLDRLLAHKA